MSALTPTFAIDDSFKAQLPALQADEYAALEFDIRANGCRDPLVVWAEKGILVDGHNRYAICTKYGLPYSVTDRSFADRDAVEDWIDANQLGRRNLTPEQFKLALGRRYNRQKRAGFKGNQHTTARDQIDPHQNAKTAQRLASEHDVSPATVKRAGSFAREFDEATERAVPEVREAYSRGELKPSEVVTIADLDESVQAEVAAMPEFERKAHVANNSGNNEWYTPQEFIDAARFVLGGFDLDPASSEIANRRVQAERYFTAQDDGLSRDWNASRIWMNPPYAQPLIGQFCAKFAAEVHNGAFGVVLVNNATETAWFQELASVCSAICFPSKRIRFLDPEGNPGAPLQGQAILYAGDNVEAFKAAHEGFGLVVRCG